MSDMTMIDLWLRVIAVAFFSFILIMGTIYCLIEFLDMLGIREDIGRDFKNRMTLIHCKDCKYCKREYDDTFRIQYLLCSEHGGKVVKEGYCYWGERDTK